MNKRKNNQTKKIIILSDGTGNSAAKRHKTNVWRLYEALDLSRNDQIAMYDDGVGSQKFFLFKLLGGVFGWGLKRNVIEMYEFLCRNYKFGKREGDQDRIYLFGFSRGAFTVRVLVGLIAECGLCTDFKSKRDLHNEAKKRFAVYRKSYKKRRSGKNCPQTCDCSCKQESKARDGSPIPKIEFLGVWDTVDAYGLPIDELADLWDRIYKFRFRDNRLSRHVVKACHALSIDDERLTFHPVLWDESRECDDRIEQVWFPGAHSDVGGGYPRHNLSLVSLNWMISKVDKSNGNSVGLVFFDDLLSEYSRRCDWNGKQHDSRAGLGTYYRYKPRDIEALSRHAGAAGGKAGQPKIHYSTFKRIQSKIVPYAPTGIPRKYNIIKAKGVATHFESGKQKGQRVWQMNSALDIIYWRRWLYYVFVLTTLLTILLLVTFPIPIKWKVSSCCTCFVDTVLNPLRIATDCILPDFASCLIKSVHLHMHQHTGYFFFLVAIYVASLIFLKCIWSKKTFERSEAAWAALKSSQAPSSPWCETLTSKLRTMSSGVMDTTARNAWWLILCLALLAVILKGTYCLYCRFYDCTICLCVF
ncbi:MAG: DUF2235 domain-containing protein [Gammaproteobacteria bacterium]|nr:DUF2235 domain-containing protein [Gammaproteobacteria bacterium]